MKRMPAISETDTDHIAEQIKQGFTQGEICPTDDNGNSTGRGWWKLETKIVWTD